MPRQGTSQKLSAENKARKLSQPNSNGKPVIEPTKSSVLSSSRYNSQVNTRKSKSTTQSTSMSENIRTTNGKEKECIKKSLKKSGVRIVLY